MTQKKWKKILLESLQQWRFDYTKASLFTIAVVFVVLTLANSYPMYFEQLVVSYIHTHMGREIRAGKEALFHGILVIFL